VPAWAVARNDTPISGERVVMKAARTDPEAIL
jgi:hypothetical protein